MSLSDHLRFYSSAETAAKAGVTYRQLDYWVRNGLIVPSVSQANGQGTRRQFSAEDVRRVWVVGQFTQQDCKSPVRTLDGINDLHIPSRGYVVAAVDGGGVEVLTSKTMVQQRFTELDGRILVVPLR